MIHPSQPFLPNSFAIHNGIQARSTGENTAQAALEMGPDSLNPYGLLHGGAYYTLADCACGTACRNDGRKYVTLHGGIDFIRSAQSGTITASAVVRHRGHTTCQVSVEITDQAGVLLATGNFTFFCITQH
ncbi:PaaI family thioesterase [Pseudoflavonifractor phocaeensis]|uniref:PaaI family thioesterase n=1 Tax=Pseudoflavonifractor phocaeensis TaxID=1870988 RepID=UPI00195C44EB|nr:PaaI family thioesterase [Pseudoflavonifractor phocaeensis]MBM6926084.1 PaaI family thioesterase [Pseudoflavonifractor phocaeensis]